MTPTAAQLAALRFFDGFPPDGTARAEWIMEYAERRYMRAGNDGDAAYRLRAETAHRIVERCVAAGWIDASAWCLTDAGREALEAPNKGGK